MGELPGASYRLVEYIELFTMFLQYSYCGICCTEGLELGGGLSFERMGLSASHFANFQKSCHPFRFLIPSRLDSQFVTDVYVS